MTGLEIFFSVTSIVVAIIGIIVGVIGGNAIHVSNKKQIKNNTLQITQNNNGLKLEDINYLLDVRDKKIMENVEVSINMMSDFQKQNISQIISLTLSQIKERENMNKLDVDWSMRFFKYSGETSNKNLQIYWSKLLVSKLEKNVPISLRTLEVVSNLSPDEARLFEELSNYVIEGEFIPQELIEKERIEYKKIMTLKDCGIVANDSFLYINSNISKDESDNFKSDKYLLSYKSKKNSFSLHLSIYELTRAGKELMNSLGYKCNEKFFFSFAKWFKEEYKNEAIVSLHSINSIQENKIDYDNNDLLEEEKSFCEIK